jgi:hypothetical protein
MAIFLATGPRFCTLVSMKPSTPPPSIIEVLVTVSAVLARRAILGLGAGARRVLIDGPRRVASSLRAGARHGLLASGSLAGVVARRGHLFAALLRRALLLASMIVLAIAGGSLVAASPDALIPSTPEVFFVAFAVCGGLCIAAPERRLRLGGLAVGTVHGVFAALTWFGTHA